MKFARIFEFKTGQLLLSITTNSDVNGYVLSLETYHLGSFIRSGIPFSNFGDAAETMEELTHQKAELLFQSLIDCVEKPAAMHISKVIPGVIYGFEKWLNNKN